MEPNRLLCKALAIGVLDCQFFFLVADTRLSSGQLAYGVRGYPGPEYMYNMNWESCSFMCVRHVPMHGTLPRGLFVATVHFMQLV